MKNDAFEHDKEALLEKIYIAQQQNPNCYGLKALSNHLKLKKSTKELNGFFERFVQEALNIPDGIKASVIKFEREYLDYTEQLLSEELSQVAKKLVKSGLTIIGFSKGWPEKNAYKCSFGEYFDIDQVSKEMNFSKKIEIIEYNDKMGGFKGFYDNNTKEAVVSTNSAMFNRPPF